MPDSLTPKAQADKMFQALIKGKEVHRQFEESMKREFTISGHTIDYWHDKFRVQIPNSNINPAEIQKLAVKIMELVQEAGFYNALAQAKSQSIKRGTETSYLTKFNALVAEYKQKGGRLPSADTLDKLAKLDNIEVDSALSIADIEVKFWKDILLRLETYRRLLENAAMVMSTELKYLNTGMVLDRVERKNNGG